MKKFFQILPLFILCFGLSFSQSGKRDTISVNFEHKLLNEISTAQNDSIKAELYLKLTKLLEENNPQKALGYLVELSSVIPKNPLSSLNIRYRIRYGAVEMALGNFKKASEYFFSALNSAEKSGNNVLVESALNNLAILNMKSGRYEKGIEYFKKLLEIAREENDKEDEDAYLLNLSLAYSQNNQLKEAEKNLLELFFKTQNDFYKAVAANSLSYIYVVSGKYSKALFYGKTAVALAGKVNRVMLKLEALTNYANALRGLKRYEEAKKTMDKILSISKERNLRFQYVNTLNDISKLYEDKKDYANALKYFKMYSAKKDSLAGEDLKKQIQELEVKYETAKKDKEIALKEATIKRKNLFLTFTFSIIILLIIFSAIIFILYKKKKHAYEQLVRQQMEAIETDGKLLKASIALNANSLEKTNKLNLNDKRVEDIYDELEKKIKIEKLFLNKDLTLGKLANEFGISSKYLSQIIHSKYGETFPDFINRLRVKEAARLLADPAFDNFSLEGIAELAGFNSRSAFNAAFKKFMGVTPSFYQKSARKFV